MTTQELIQKFNQIMVMMSRDFDVSERSKEILELPSATWTEAVDRFEKLKSDNKE